VEEKFSKEMEIMKNNQVEMFEMKTSVNQIQTTMDSVIHSKIKQKKEHQREDKIEELLHTSNHKEKIIHMSTIYKNSGT
jgi:hypothetical protein